MRGFNVLARAALVCALLQTALSGSKAAEPLDAARRIVESEWRNYQTPGMSVALVMNDELVWSAGFGFADIENKIPAQADTVYRIASISKPIAATAVMQQVETGRVALDDPIQQYVPSFPAKPEGAITLRHLLTHTSGIRHYRGMEVLSWRRYDSVADGITIFQDDALEFAPGAQFKYSSYGYNLLAGVVERAAKARFRDYLRRHIFRPAGMNDSDLEFLEEARLRARQYVRFDNGYAPAPAVDLSYKWAGGGIASTAPDLARFHIALNRGKLLKPSTHEAMLQPMKLGNGEISSYGLGWRVETDKQNRTWVHHSGGATGGTTFLRRNPKEGNAVVVLCNAQTVEGLAAFTLKIAEAMLPPHLSGASPRNDE
ncbi:MAG: serine hydrolase domain-containing protein [Verrucomicrobiota bacterium]